MLWPCTSPRTGRRARASPGDLGINRATLREWVLRDRERRGLDPVSRAQGREAAAGAGQTAPPADPDERIRQLEARAAELEASERKMSAIRPAAGSVAEASGSGRAGGPAVGPWRGAVGASPAQYATSPPGTDTAPARRTHHPAPAVPSTRGTAAYP
jgi:transposase-like protein